MKQILVGIQIVEMYLSNHLNVTLNLSMDDSFVIDTPLMWLNKAQTWELADQA